MKHNLPEGYYAGTSGLVVPIPKYQFPKEHEASSRLKYYATLFKSIEINSSFYKLPQERTMMKWSLEVPADFRFTFKLWREITHAKHLAFKAEDVEKFMQVISRVGDKRGCLLIQFPPSLRYTDVDGLLRLLQCLNELDPQIQWPIALEFRDRSWYNDEIDELVEAHHATIVVHDKKGNATPSHRQENFIYLRFHGPGGNYRGSYSDEFLDEYAGYIREWLAEKKTVYVYFNNTMGEAIPNLNTLNRYVGVLDNAM